MRIQASVATRSSALRTLDWILHIIAVAGLAAAARLRFFVARASQRRALVQLNDRLLRDIGITREEALAEFRKPFWFE